MTVLDHVATLRGFARHSSVSRDVLVEYQNRQLRRLIRHAYANVPYYRRLFDEHGVKPEEIRTADDLRRVPITSRDVLQQVPADQLVARAVDPRRVIVHHTTGSSGKPLNVRRTWMEERILGLLRLRAHRSFGVRATDRRCKIVTPSSIHSKQNEMLQGLVWALGFFFMTTVDGYAPPAAIVDALRAARPRMLSGAPGLLARIATIVDPEALRSLRLRNVICGGSVLAPWMRRRIEEGFAAPLYECYGAHEFNLIAWQCRDTDALHCCDDGLVMEILDGGRPVADGEPGEVVGTNLHAFAMPIIRYRLGDVVTRGSQTCGCGQPFSTIRAIRGRMVDYFHLPNGRVLHPYELVREPWQRSAPWIREYQVTQETVDRVVIRIVAGYNPSAEELRVWRAPAEAVLGPAVTLEVRLVPEIALEPSGKFRVFRSLVQSTHEA